MWRRASARLQEEGGWTPASLHAGEPQVRDHHPHSLRYHQGGYPELSSHSVWHLLLQLPHSCPGVPLPSQTFPAHCAHGLQSHLLHVSCPGNRHGAGPLVKRHILSWSRDIFQTWAVKPPPAFSLMACWKPLAGSRARNFPTLEHRQMVATL